MWRAKVLGTLSGQVLRIWRSTVKIEVRGIDILDELPHAPLAVWHGRMQGVIFALRGRRVLSMASNSADGEIAARAVAALDIRVVRGSTLRGGRHALDEMIDWVGDGLGDHAALTVDGPRGPAQRVKLGAIQLARKFGRVIIPMSFSASRTWTLRSWDRMILARPFSRLLVQFGPPLELDPDEPSRYAAKRLKAALDEMTRRLDIELHGHSLWDTPTNGKRA
ncbi:MAG: lysophospholipid acyltransferase family protein [Acidobacteria bacterium]|nr:lysophospholipid acyltransferase family protein [Acidobacteriota bacterium]